MAATAQRLDPASGRLWVRKSIHLAVGLLAFALAWGPAVAITLTAALTIFNLLLWPRLGGRRLWHDPQARWDVGIVAYPLVLFLLVLCFHHRLEIVAAVWGILAFGDGMAALLGHTFGRRALPWNAAKTWVGLASHGLFGTLGAWGLLVWMLPPDDATELLFLAVVGLAAAGLSAAVESLPLGLDDNLTAPPLAALLLWGLLASKDWWLSGAWHELQGQAAWAFLVASGLAMVSYAAASVDLSGAAAGWLLAGLITTCLGWRGLLIFGAFFVVGSVLTRCGWAAKVRRGVAQERSGRRSARNALANVGVPAVLAVFAVTTPLHQELTVAFVAALAAATADTASSEVGQVWGGRPILITTWQAAAPGVDGGITWLGSLAGLLGGGLIAALAWGVGWVDGSVIPWVIAASLLGNLLDSFLGATLERRGLLDNEAVNFAATLGAALCALAAVS